MSYFNACDVAVANSNHKICYNFFSTCTCAPHFEKGSATHVKSTYKSLELTTATRLPTSVANSSHNKYTKSCLKIYQIHICNKTYNLMLVFQSFFYNSFSRWLTVAAEQGHQRDAAKLKFPSSLPVLFSFNPLTSMLHGQNH